VTSPRACPRFPAVPAEAPALPRTGRSVTPSRGQALCAPSETRAAARARPRGTRAVHGCVGVGYAVADVRSGIHRYMSSGVWPPPGEVRTTAGIPYSASVLVAFHGASRRMPAREAASQPPGLRGGPIYASRGGSILASAEGACLSPLAASERANRCSGALDLAVRRPSLRSHQAEHDHIRGPRWAATGDGAEGPHVQHPPAPPPLAPHVSKGADDLQPDQIRFSERILRRETSGSRRQTPPHGGRSHPIPEVRETIRLVDLIDAAPAHIALRATPGSGQSGMYRSDHSATPARRCPDLDVLHRPPTAAIVRRMRFAEGLSTVVRKLAGLLEAY
jgi:hypothetical protein